MPTPSSSSARRLFDLIRKGKISDTRLLLHSFPHLSSHVCWMSEAIYLAAVSDHPDLIQLLRNHNPKAYFHAFRVVLRHRNNSVIGRLIESGPPDSSLFSLVLKMGVRLNRPSFIIGLLARERGLGGVIDGAILALGLNHLDCFNHLVPYLPDRFLDEPKFVNAITGYLSDPTNSLDPIDRLIQIDPQVAALIP